MRCIKFLPLCLILLFVSSIQFATSQKLFRFEDGAHAEITLTFVSRLYLKNSRVDEVYEFVKPLPYVGILKFGKRKFELGVYNTNNDKLMLGIYPTFRDKPFKITKLTDNEETYTLDRS